MTSLDESFEELIKERNAFEAENNLLKANLEYWQRTSRYTRKINNRLASEFIKDMNPEDVDLVWLERDQIKELSELEQAGGISSIKADAVQGFADTLDGNSVIKVYESRIKKDGRDYAIKLRSNNG